MKDALSDYKKHLLSCSNISREFGLMSIQPNSSVSDDLELNIDGTKISIWAIYEVVLAIHFFPNSKPAKFRNLARLAKANIKNQYNSLRNTLLPNTNKDLQDIDVNNVIFLGFSDYLAFENFDLIFEKMEEDNKYEPLWIDDKYFDNFKLSDKHINISEISSKEIKTHASKIKYDIKRLIQKLTKDIKSSHIDSKKSELLLSALSFMRPQMETSIPLYISVAIYLLNKIKPSAIISIDVADPCNRVFSLLANKLHIPVIQIQAGPINQECIEWLFCYDDLMLSHGPHVKSELVQLGFDSNKIVEVGSAKLEKSIISNQSEGNSLRNNFKIEKDNSVILFLTSYVDLFDTQHHLSGQRRIYNDTYQAVIDEVTKRKNLTLVIKPHPLEKPHQLKAHKLIASKVTNIFVANPSDNTSEMISDSDVVISYGSTATIDAIVFGKLVICPKFENFALNTYFDESNAILVPKNAKELNDIFRVIDSGDISEAFDRCSEGRSIFLKDFSNLDTSASEAILSNIYSTIEIFSSKREEYD